MFRPLIVWGNLRGARRQVNVIGAIGFCFRDLRYFYAKVPYGQRINTL